MSGSAHARNYADLVQEESLGQLFLKTVWGERMSRAMMMCQRPNIAIQRCLATHNDDITKCHEQVVEMEHCAHSTFFALLVPDPALTLTCAVSNIR